MAASPVFLERPYRSLKPPLHSGKEKIGRPAITSSMYMNSAASSAASSLNSRTRFNQSHPSIPSNSMLFQTLLDRPTIPSLRTRRAPPLTRLVSTRGRFLNEETSTGSVSVPVTSTGRFLKAFSKLSSRT